MRSAPDSGASPARDAQGHAPIHAYAAIGDGRSTALIAPDGSIDWWCAPNMDSPPLFDRLLDAEAGGRFALQARGVVSVRRRYRADSNVLETEIRTSTGFARVTESLNSGPAGRLPWSELARRVEGLEGEVLFDLHYQPGTRAGTCTPWMSDTPNGCVHHVGPVMTMLRYPGDTHIELCDDRAVQGQLRVTAGYRGIVALLASQDEVLPVPPLDDIDTRIDRSDREWQQWVADLHCVSRQRGEVICSALALKFLWFSPTGAIAAAVTASLPERLGGDKNWDYRYAWVRDAAYIIKAFLRVGALPDAKAGFSWLMTTIGRHRPALRPCYTLRGETVEQERYIDIPGYHSSQPVRVGNTATDQLQTCVYGDVMEMASRMIDAGHILDPTTARLLFELADECADRWMRKDCGFWELDDLQHYTMSKVECWMALRRACELAEQGHITRARLPRWQRERDRILDWIDTHCWHEEKQSYVMHAGSDRLDASLMLASRFGLAQARRERFIATREAMRRELSDASGDLLWRYSGMQQCEGTFISCAFWMVEAYGLLGEQEEAHRLFHALLQRVRNDVGLMPEMWDPFTERGLGNTPQGLSHLALVHAAFAVDGE
ncbi:glycoside hydrolase family 15 protein [Stenotrophomonas sp. YAU14D1_LEIMI4_1]|uniref:glycoside hydrolase family 15 protein n=1 Tax=Stenotrophomonas sp. YAU14D1_LEIMI4_1 TaxID=2072407 RepID=UPI000D53D838|nr:glycoside hydrolase family 15 protein [Stenotrophomonas sp. YAU14D1_LEIMI4_1]AWH25417.1 glycoside hydrolase family 15 [Stenotrophomonas sp. YAU14D1_LEIMI4_1]